MFNLGIVCVFLIIMSLPLGGASIARKLCKFGGNLPHTACIPTHLADCSRNVRPWPFFQLSSVQSSRSVVSDSLRPRESQHAGPRQFLRVALAASDLERWGNVSLWDREQAFLLVTYEIDGFPVLCSSAVRPVTVYSHCVHPSGPCHITPIGFLGQEMSCKHGGVPAACCVMSNEALCFLPRNLKSACLHPWNSSLLSSKE